MKRIPISPAPAIQLTDDQLRIAQLFANMDERRQQEAIVKMTRMAAAHPRRARPALHLVSGGVL